MTPEDELGSAHKAEQELPPETEITPETVTPEDKEAWERKYAGEYELTDAGIGRVEEVIVSYTDPLELQDAISRQELFSPDKKIRILCPPSVDLTEFQNTYFSMLRERGIPFDEQNISFQQATAVQTPWMRDSMLRGKNPRTGKDAIFDHHHNQAPNWTFRAIKRPNDADLSRELATLLPETEFHEISPYFEGGDMRAVGPYIFIGKNTFERAKDSFDLFEGSYFVLPDGEVRGVGDRPREEMQRELGEGAVFHEAPEEGTDHWVIQIGEKYYDQSAISKEEIGEKIKAEYQRLFGREVMIVGEGIPKKQPAGHIDMFITFLPNKDGKPTVVVGDAGLTKKMLNGMDKDDLSEETAEGSDLIDRQFKQLEGIPTSESFTDEQKKNTGSEYVLNNLAMVNAERYRDILNGKIDPERHADYYTAWHKKVEKFEAGLNAHAEWFKQRGFEVERIPIVPQPRADQGKLEAYKAAISINTFNNGLVEAYVDEENRLQKSFAMPSYGFRKLEHAAAEVFRKHGYKVKKSPLVHYPYNKGAWNCSTQEKRS